MTHTPDRTSQKYSEFVLWVYIGKTPQKALLNEEVSADTIRYDGSFAWFNRQRALRRPAAPFVEIWMDKSHLLPAKSFPLCGGEAVGPQHLALVSPKRKHIVHREKPWVSYFTQKIILKHSLNQQKDASASAFTLILPSADRFYGCFLNSTSVLIWEVGGWGGLKEQVATATSCSNLQSPTCFFLQNCNKIDELDFDSETRGRTTALLPILWENLCFGNVCFFQTVCNEPECHFISWKNKALKIRKSFIQKQLNQMGDRGIQ